jgi:hypothetical protein
MEERRLTMVMPESIAAQLSVPQRVLILCLASGTDWRKAGIRNPTVQLAIVKKLVERDEATSQLELTDQGRAVLAALLGSDR